MSAVHFTVPDPPAAPPPTASAPAAITPEATARALIVGSALGVVMAAANVYSGLKTSFIDGGSITAALLGFTLFATFKGLARRPYTALENNITQTTASSAAIMVFVMGLYGPIPALSMMGHHLPMWAVWVWGLALGVLGIFLGASLRAKLVVAEKLPFPTGAATAEIIEAMYAARETAIRRARLLLFSALAAALITWFREGRPQLIPGMTALPVTIAGLSATALGLGISWSPMMMSTGMFMGLRNAGSMLLGALGAWALVVPTLVVRGIVAGPGFGQVIVWLVWPGLGLMAAGTVLPLLLNWRALARSAFDLRAMLPGRGQPAAPTAALVPLQKTMMAAAVAAVVGLAWLAFDVHPVVTMIGVLFAVILAGVCGRAAGETDLAPIGAVAMLTQLVFAGAGMMAAFTASVISAGSASQTSQTLWALKAGHRLKASPRAQITGQLVGALVGGVVVLPVYLVLVKSYGIGTDALPAPSALSWKATLEGIRGGLAVLPAYAPAAGAVGLAIGTVLALLARSRVARWVPSPIAVGIAVLTPASLSFAAFLGALALFVARRARPSLADSSTASLAAGGIAGESIVGILVAALIAAGLLAK